MRNSNSNSLLEYINQIQNLYWLNFFVEFFFNGDNLCRPICQLELINLLIVIKNQTFDSKKKKIFWKKKSNTQLDKKLIETTCENGNTTIKNKIERNKEIISQDTKKLTDLIWLLGWEESQVLGVNTTTLFGFTLLVRTD